MFLYYEQVHYFVYFKNYTFFTACDRDDRGPEVDF